MQAFCLSGKGVTNQHETVTNNHHFVCLDELLKERVNGLHIHLAADLLCRLHENAIVGLGQLDSREQIRCDA